MKYDKDGPPFCCIPKVPVPAAADNRSQYVHLGRTPTSGPLFPTLSETYTYSIYTPNTVDNTYTYCSKQKQLHMRRRSNARSVNAMSMCYQLVLLTTTYVRSVDTVQQDKQKKYIKKSKMLYQLVLLTTTAGLSSRQSTTGTPLTLRATVTTVLSTSAPCNAAPSRAPPPCTPPSPATSSQSLCCERSCADASPAHAPSPPPAPGPVLILEFPSVVSPAVLPGPGVLLFAASFGVLDQAGVVREGARRRKSCRARVQENARQSQKLRCKG